MAVILCDSAIVHTCPRAILLATINMRKSIHEWVSMERQNCLMILFFIILGGYVIIYGGYVIIFGG